jgi:methyl-accepting chemotaxis protein
VGFREKIVGLGVAVMIGVAGLQFWLNYRDAQRQIVQQYVEKARSVVLTAESAREEMGRKWDQQLFTTEQLRTWAREGHTDRVLAAVPVVTAWRAAMAKSQEGGYTFKVPKFQPRNPKNTPDAVEARVLKAFETGAASEHYEVDTEKNAIRYFRPIRLTSECLVCHGDPAQSQTLWGRSDGKDPTGGPFEGWKAGEVHGAFEVVQSLDQAHADMGAAVKRSATLVG